MSNDHYQNPEDIFGEGFRQTGAMANPMDPDLGSILEPVQHWVEEEQPWDRTRRANSLPLDYQASGGNTASLPPMSSATLSNLGDMSDPVDPAVGHAFQIIGQATPSSSQPLPASSLAAPTPAQAATSHNLHRGSIAQALLNLPCDSWACPVNDDTIPFSQAKRAGWVEKLLAAISNVHNVDDKIDGAFTAAWFSPATGVFSDHYTMETREDVAWNILTLAEDLHRYGAAILETQDKVTQWREARQTRAWTFEYRMNRIIELLTRSKSRCEMLLSDTGFHAVVGNPAAMIAATGVNARENNARQVRLSIVRANEQRSG